MTRDFSMIINYCELHSCLSRTGWLCTLSMDRKSLKAEPEPVPRLVLEAGWLCLPVEQKQEKWQLLPCNGLRLCKAHSLRGFVTHTPENAPSLPKLCKCKGKVDTMQLL